MKVSAIIIIVTLSLAACAESKLEIFKIEEETEKEIMSHTGEADKLFIRESFIIANPVQEQQKLKEIIDIYNQKTINYPQVDAFCISRTFYKESFLYDREFKPYYDVVGAKIKLIDVAYDNRLMRVHFCKNANDKTRISYDFF
ncbi:MAG: hypothetical protein HRT35_02970 [Algicola sp.]|nr:hypothetical protein [Algicola sp.]